MCFDIILLYICFNMSYGISYSLFTEEFSQIIVNILKQKTTSSSLRNENINASHCLHTKSKIEERKITVKFQNKIQNKHSGYFCIRKPFNYYYIIILHRDPFFSPRFFDFSFGTHIFNCNTEWARKGQKIEWKRSA